MKTNDTKERKDEILTGERALFMSDGLSLRDCIFADGESPLKESRNILLDACSFKWKYPLWYCHNIKMRDCILFETARAGIWYTENLTAENTVIEAPKTFRRAKNMTLKNVSLPNAQETLWFCDGLLAEHISAKGDYFALCGTDMTFRDLTLCGNYSFDGAKNLTVSDSKLLSKDAFWNSENVTVKNSYISGEYLGWNAKNLTLIDCTIESLQGMCYIENLVLKNCRLLNTTLAFEYSTVDADIASGIKSVLNPSGGRIVADHIDELILENDKIDPNKTHITVRNENND